MTVEGPPLHPTGAILRATRSALVIDWPSRDVPETMVRAGWTVTVRNGPGARDFAAFERDGDDIVSRPVGVAPDHVDLVYVHRPLAELEAQVGVARALGATAIWRQSGLAADGRKDPLGCWVPAEEAAAARRLVAAAGLAYVDSPYIGDALRGLMG